MLRESKVVNSLGGVDNAMSALPQRSFELGSREPNFQKTDPIMNTKGIVSAG